MSLISLWYSNNDKTQTIIVNKKIWFENHYDLCQINPTTMITMMLQKVGRVQVVTIQLSERCFLCQPCSGDKLHRASYCHSKLLHLILLPSAPLPSLWPKSPESEQGVQDSIHWQPCFLQVQTGHSVSSAMRARYKSVWTDARTDSSLTSLTCTLYYTATTFMSVSVICTSMEDGMFSPREWQR